jgi:excisionase family DNA binding protein
MSQKMICESNKLEQLKKAQGISSPLSKRLYTLPEAATYLGRTIWSMRELVWKGSIPIVREGKRIFIDMKDLDQYIQKNKTTFV